MSEQQDKERQKDLDDIQNAKEVHDLLQHAAVQAALKRVEKDCFDEFKKADTEEKRQNAWAKSWAMQALLNELHGIMNGAGVAQSRENNRRAAEAVRERATRK